MSNTVVNVFRQLMTGKDNVSHDMGKWSWLISTVAVLGAAGFSMYKGNIVDLMQLAGALGTIATTHGIALGVKSMSEPKAE